MGSAQRNQNNKIARRGLMLVLSSPSGAGKTTLSRLLLCSDRKVELSISVTTRPKRRGEIDGRDYHFIDRGRFDWPGQHAPIACIGRELAEQGILAAAADDVNRIQLLPQ